jgi:hypothetical protein
MTVPPPPLPGRQRWLPPALFLGWVGVLALFFAQVEINIEGGAGWAASLPTWRLEHHWLLNLFWGGRPLTGYHVWIFSFMFLVFHFPLVVFHQLSLRLEARALGGLMLFWITEDLLWFLLNPAYGLGRLQPGAVPWHIHWFLGLPTDYWTFGIAGAALVTWSYWRRAVPAAAPPPG